MDNKSDRIIAELRNNEEEIINFYKGLNAMQLGVIVYQEDPPWSVQQVLAHFITIEHSMHLRYGLCVLSLMLVIGMIIPGAVRRNTV